MAQVTAPLLSEQQIRDLVYSVCGDNSLNESATRKAIRTAVKLAGEEAAKVCDDLLNRNADGSPILRWPGNPPPLESQAGKAIRARL